MVKARKKHLHGSVTFFCDHNLIISKNKLLWVTQICWQATKKQKKDHLWYQIVISYGLVIFSTVLRNFRPQRHRWQSRLRHPWMIYINSIQSYMQFYPACVFIGPTLCPYFSINALTIPYRSNRRIQSIGEKKVTFFGFRLCFMAFSSSRRQGISSDIPPPAYQLGHV
jgi:hypothetical protein